MSSRKLIWIKRFSKDVNLAKRRNRNLESLQKVTKMLQSADILSQEYKPHPLKGKYSGYMEYHIEPDWLGVKKNLTVPPEAGWSQRGASIWRSQFRAGLDVVSVSRASMAPGNLEMVEI